MTAKMGRPEVGPAINIRLPRELLAAIDARAEQEGSTRVALIRQALSERFTK